MLHLGPYAVEEPTIARLHAFIAQQGRAPRGATTRSTSATPALARPNG